MTNILVMLQVDEAGCWVCRERTANYNADRRSHDEL